jgi:hypothetical protein
MKEGQEIFTSKKKLFNRDFEISYQYICTVGIFGGIIFIFIGLTIALISETENKYLIAFIEFLSGMGFILMLASWMILILGIGNEFFTNKEAHKADFSYYDVIYFNDRLVFKRYSENGELGNFQIFYPQIKSFDQENDRISVKLVFGILDDEIQKREGYDWHDKGNTTSQIENQSFRKSKKLSKSDRVRILDFLKMHIERSKAS